MARSDLGGSLLGQGRLAESEPLVIGGYEGLEARRSRIPCAVQVAPPGGAIRVVRLYESWGKTDMAVAWKSRLRMLDLPVDVFAPPGILP